MAKQIKLTDKDIIKKLKSCLSKFVKDDTIFYYRTILTKDSLYPSKLTYWLNKDIPAITKLYNDLESIQEHRIVDGMLHKSSDINATAAIFYLKSKKKYIEYERQQQVTNNISDFAISVNYDVKPSRTENDITKLIEEVHDAS